MISATVLENAGLVLRTRRLWVAAALMLSVIVDAWLIPVMAQWPPGVDLFPAWSVDLADPWFGSDRWMTGFDLFRHSPVVAQFASLFSWVPWIAAQLVFLVVQVAAIVLMAGRRWPYVVLFPGVFWNLYFGNVDLLMGAALVAGFRYPGAWALFFLTKISPGIGVLWFAFRGEWRKFVIALGTTALIVAGSFALAPDLWFRWFEALQAWQRFPQMAVVPALMVRLPFAVALVWFAARTNRKWILPIACLLAIPNPWFVTFAILGATVALIPPPSGPAHSLRDLSSRSDDTIR